MALDYNIIGERLKKARTENNLTQEKLAEKLDVSIAFLSRIERGSSHISLKRLSQQLSLLFLPINLRLPGLMLRRRIFACVRLFRISMN